MFEPGESEPFYCGRPRWATEPTYDENLATFVGDLARSRDVRNADTRGLARARSADEPSVDEP